MMNHVVNFLCFMLFSSFDFFTLYFVALSLFNINPIYYKKELIIIVSISTLVSYLFIQFDIYRYVPSFLVTLLIVTLLLKFFIINEYSRIKKKWLYTTFISIASVMIYALIQFALIAILVHFDFLTFNDLTNSFSYKTYITQSATSIIGCIISIYIISSKGGFGFIFKAGRYKLFTIITFLLLLITSILFQIFSNGTKSMHFFILIALVLSVSSIIVFYLSYKQDDSEYK